MAQDTWMVLPPARDCCQVCARKHEPELPHDATTLFYQTTFNLEHGRAPTWMDAWAHGAQPIREQFRRELIARGVDVDAGKVYPPRKADA